VSFDRHDEEVLQVVREVAADALESRAAALVVNEESSGGGTLVTFRLTPQNSSACAVVVQPDYDAQISLFLGPDETTATLELWDEDRGALIETLRELLSAVVEGRYEQKVKVTGRKNRRLSVKGMFALEDGPREHSYSGGTAADLGDKKWHLRKFVAY
jgi:hypothetical protein